MSVIAGIVCLVALIVSIAGYEIYDRWQWRQDQKRWMVMLDLELAYLNSPHDRRHS